MTKHHASSPKIKREAFKAADWLDEHLMPIFGPAQVGPYEPVSPEDALDRRWHQPRRGILPRRRGHRPIRMARNLLSASSSRSPQPCSGYWFRSRNHYGHARSIRRVSPSSRSPSPPS